MSSSLKNSKIFIWIRIINLAQLGRSQLVTSKISFLNGKMNLTFKHFEIVTIILKLKSIRTVLSFRGICLKVFIGCTSIRSFRKIYDRIFIGFNEWNQGSCYWEYFSTVANVWWWTNSLNLQYWVSLKSWYVLNKEISSWYPYHFKKSSAIEII